MVVYDTPIQTILRRGCACLLRLTVSIGLLKSLLEHVPIHLPTLITCTIVIHNCSASQHRHVANFTSKCFLYHIFSFGSVVMPIVPIRLIVICSITSRTNTATLFNGFYQDSSCEQSREQLDTMSIFTGRNPLVSSALYTDGIMVCYCWSGIVTQVVAELRLRYCHQRISIRLLKVHIYCRTIRGPTLKSYRQGHHQTRSKRGALVHDLAGKISSLMCRIDQS